MVLMNHAYENGVMLDVYERILLDCMEGDRMLFARADGVEQTWSVLTPVIDALEAYMRENRLSIYPSGSSGPERSVLETAVRVRSAIAGCALL